MGPSEPKSLSYTISVHQKAHRLSHPSVSSEHQNQRVIIFSVQMTDRRFLSPKQGPGKKRDFLKKEM